MSGKKETSPAGWEIVEPEELEVGDTVKMLVRIYGVRHERECRVVQTNPLVLQDKYGNRFTEEQIGKQQILRLRRSLQILD